MKMKVRKDQIQAAASKIVPIEYIQEADSVPVEDTVNREEHEAYSLPDKLRLVTMLNTLKLQPQYYRSENEQITELQKLIEKVALEDPYFVCQAIVWSRCMGEGMRTVNHLAAAFVAPFISGHHYAKRFYSEFDKTTKRGGCIFRLDDMSEIKDAYFALTGKPLTNAMRKGFAHALSMSESYQLSKYSKTVKDIANLSHPGYKLAGEKVTVDGEEIATLDAIMRGIRVQANTWENNQSRAGQEVSKAVLKGDLSEEEAKIVLAEKKADNWETLLRGGKLGIIAALRNIRNIMQNPRKETIEAWCCLVTDPGSIKRSLVLPVYFDLAYSTVTSEFLTNEFAPQVQQALLNGYEASIPNLSSIFVDSKTAVVVDCSGSMGSVMPCFEHNRGMLRMGRFSTNRCSYKAGLIAATIAKASKADVYKFGDRAREFSYDVHENVFALAKKIGTSEMGFTNAASAFELITKKGVVYDRIIFISDNEMNRELPSKKYAEYIRNVASPYIYAIDLAGYGTTPLANPGKVKYLFGYGPALYRSIASKEFKAERYIEEIEKVII